MALLLTSRGATKNPTIVEATSEQNSEFEISLGTKPLAPVDRGSKAWTVLAGSMCVIYATYGLLASNGLFLSYWTAHELSDYSNSEVGWITAINVFLTLFLGGQTGVLFDKYGHRVLLAFGSLLYVTGLFVTGQCTQYWHFMLAYGVVAGTGCGITSSVALAVIVQWFDKKRGMAMGLIFLGSSIGGVTFPLIARAIFDRLSWANCARVIGSVVFAMLLVGNMCITRRQVDKTERSIDYKAFLDLKFISVTAGLGMFEFALFGTLGLLPEVSNHLKYSTATSFNVLAVMNGCSGLGRITCGYLSDRIGAFNSIILSASLSMLSVLAFSLRLESSIVLFYVFAASFGFWSGSMISLGPTCVARLCRVEVYGQYYGTSYSITSFVNLIGVPVGGKLLDALGAKWLSVIFALMLLVSAVCLSITRWTVLGRHWSWTIKV